ncbi:DUF2779 domain-containing protein [Pelotalea chapellei]|nr:DUF2779 domain-containing protein [Pelotalea chapellei]
MPKQLYQLSKSRYMKGRQCHKSLWLYTYKPELLEVSEAAEQAFTQGHEVGELARDIFPKGVLIPFGGFSYDQQVQQTQAALATAKVIYEAAFTHNGIFVKADILRKVRGGWEMYEVKGSSKLKDHYLDDAAVQYYVINGSGLTLTKAYVVHLNTSYCRNGALDHNELFTRQNVTVEVLERQADVKKEIARQKRMLKGKEPDISIGPWCSKPYNCDFDGHCWNKIPEDSVFDLAGKGVDAFDLYRQGIEKLKDIPQDLLKGKQLQQSQAALCKKTIVNKKKLREFLDSLSYPLYFLDFETFEASIPKYDGLRPFQDVPFQYSLHWQKRAGGKLYHSEYLAQPNLDPRKGIVQRLLEDIPDGACVLAYWKSFESNRLKELADHFPKKKKRLHSIIDNMKDLIDPFQARHLYSWKQKGSHSIKAVLPAFVNGMSYDELKIGNGLAAMEAYHQMCYLYDKPRELAQVRKNLLEYCKQDTLAMVKLLEVIVKKAAPPKKCK